MKDIIIGIHVSGYIWLLIFILMIYMCTLYLNGTSSYYYTGADLGILYGGGGSGPEFFEGGGGVRVQVRGNFHILTSQKKEENL